MDRREPFRRNDVNLGAAPPEYALQQASIGAAERAGLDEIADRHLVSDHAAEIVAGNARSARLHASHRVRSLSGGSDRSAAFALKLPNQRS